MKRNASIRDDQRRYEDVAHIRRYAQKMIWKLQKWIHHRKITLRTMRQAQREEWSGPQKLVHQRSGNWWRMVKCPAVHPNGHRRSEISFARRVGAETEEETDFNSTWEDLGPSDGAQTW